MLSSKVVAPRFIVPVAIFGLWRGEVRFSAQGFGRCDDVTYARQEPLIFRAIVAERADCACLVFCGDPRSGVPDMVTRCEDRSRRYVVYGWIIGTASATRPCPSCTRFCARSTVGDEQAFAIRYFAGAVVTVPGTRELLFLRGRFRGVHEWSDLSEGSHHSLLPHQI